MRKIKGFMAHTLMTSNTYGVVNTVGELSTYSLTFAKDKGIYYQNDKDALVLYTFSVKENNIDQLLTVGQREHILDVLGYVYDKAINSQVELFPAELLHDLIARYSRVANNFKCGKIVKDLNRVYLPEWISWSMIGKDTEIRIWLSDASFRASYDEYSIVVIPPIARIDDFFKSAKQVKDLLDSRDLVDRMAKVQEAKQELPETVIRTELYHWVNPLDKTNKIPTHWDILIYGEAGNNVDSIKDAVIDYILNNTERTRQEWTELFPDIFKRTEFVILPRWDLYAIPNKVIEAGIHSPLQSHRGLVDLIHPYASLYPKAHISNYLQVTAHPYKSLALAITSGNENRDNLFKLSDVFPDYIAVSSLSQDFNRQSEATRTFSEHLAKLLVLAEELTHYSDIPRGYTKLVRNDKLYIVLSYQNIHYLVVAKHNFVQE